MSIALRAVALALFVIAAVIAFGAFGVAVAEVPTILGVIALGLAVWVTATFPWRA